MKSTTKHKSDTKKRIYVTLPARHADILMSLSETDQVPFTTKAAELLQISLEEQEDQLLSLWAEKRHEAHEQDGEMYDFSHWDRV
jgi:hypothetical protein